ncbi:MAG: hypothetical protein ACREUA_09325 [Burkholderiales bacterium]
MDHAWPRTQALRINPHILSPGPDAIVVEYRAKCHVMVWFLIEAGLALALLVLIVAWTLPRSRNGDDRKD